MNNVVPLNTPLMKQLQLRVVQESLQWLLAHLASVDRLVSQGKVVEVSEAAEHLDDLGIHLPTVLGEWMAARQVDPSAAIPALTRAPLCNCIEGKSCELCDEIAWEE